MIQRELFADVVAHLHRTGRALDHLQQTRLAREQVEQAEVRPLGLLPWIWNEIDVPRLRVGNGDLVLNTNGTEGRQCPADDLLRELALSFLHEGAGLYVPYHK